MTDISSPQYEIARNKIFKTVVDQMVLQAEPSTYLTFIERAVDREMTQGLLTGFSESSIIDAANVGETQDMRNYTDDIEHMAYDGGVVTYLAHNAVREDVSSLVQEEKETIRRAIAVREGLERVVAVEPSGNAAMSPGEAYKKINEYALDEMDTDFGVDELTLNHLLGVDAFPVFAEQRDPSPILDATEEWLAEQGVLAVQ